MLELDGSETSPKAKQFSPPSLPRIPNRSVSEQATIPQLPNIPPRPDVHSANVSMPSLPASNSDPRPLVDGAFSPFNRSQAYAVPRSADSTPQGHRNGYVNQQNFHYGNRNLSPLFKAAKHDSARPSSSLRQEVHTSPQIGAVAELPDSSPSRPLNGPRRTSSKAEQAAMAFLHSQASKNGAAMPQIPLPRPQPSELDGQPSSSATTGSPLVTKPFNTKSLEDDLKRMLKLTGGIK